jgi:cytochrome c553
MTPRWFVLALVLVAASASAQTKPKPAPPPAVSYAERYASVCAACHGPQGMGEMALTPSIGAQPSFYVVTQLFLFRDGRRGESPMSAVAKTLSDDDLRGFSAFLEKLPPPAPPSTAADPARAARGKALADQHRCASCHGANYEGGQQVARLAHQREDYLQKTLREFRAGQRVGYTAAMNEALSGIKPDELDDVAHYLAHLPAR